MTGELVRGAAEVFSFTVGGGSQARVLHELTDLVTARFPGCSGATATLWEPAEVVATAASHPELAALAEQQFAAGDGPIIAALRTAEPSVTADTLHEKRWPDWAPAALAAGVRSSTTIFHAYDSVGLTLSLYGTRTEAFDLEQLPLASLLTAFGTAIMAGSVKMVQAQRAAAQLEEAIHSRAVVDQAKGVLMAAMGCDPDEAFEQLRHISQTQHIKLIEVAAKVIETRTELE